MAGRSVLKGHDVVRAGESVRATSEWATLTYTVNKFEGIPFTPIPTIGICPYTPEPGDSGGGRQQQQACLPDPTPTPAPQQLTKPTGLRMTGSRTLCWLYHADGHQQGFRVWREPVPDFIRSAQAASDPVTVTDFCHTFPVVHPRDTLYVRALGDGVRYLNSEAGHLYVGSAPELTGTPPTSTPPTSTPVTPTGPTATPTATQNPVLTQLAEPRGLKVVGGNTFCWQEVEGTTRYDAWRVAAGGTDDSDDSIPRGGFGPRSDPTPCGGGAIWYFRIFEALNPGDMLYVRAVGDGVNYRDSFAAQHTVPGLPPVRPPVQPTSVPAPTATRTPEPTQAPITLPRLPSPSGLKLVQGNILCWRNVEHATGYTAWNGDPFRSASPPPDGLAGRDAPCGGGGFGWSFSALTVFPGDALYVIALGDGVRYRNSLPASLTVPRPKPTSRPPPPTAVPPTAVPPTAVPPPPGPVAIFVYYSVYQQIYIDGVCHRQQQRCRKTCWQGTSTCWNHGQACTEWAQAGSCIGPHSQ